MEKGEELQPTREMAKEIRESHSVELWMPSRLQVEHFRHEVLTWFAQHGRDLPWRRTRDPYRILVSEMMLQQTQVARVIAYYEPFLDRFPDTATLSNATIGEVLRTWQGLGYNRRAAYLKRCAVHVEKVCGGRFPVTLAQLEDLPGVGRYTARAIACFAYEMDVAVVETNVRRAIALFADHAGARPGTYSTEAIADALVPPNRSWEWNQALMDFGALSIYPGQQKENRCPTPAFNTTDRFWRGRIVAALCNYPHAVSVPQLLRELPSGHEEYRVRTLLERMDQEGLVQHDSDRDSVELPGSSERF